MKYLKRFSQINEGYEYQIFQDESKKGEEINYYFNDEFGNKFKVNFEFKDDITAKMLYQVYDPYLKDWKFNLIKTNIYKIFKTIFKDIFNDFLSKNKWCKILKFEGLGKKSEKEQITQRTKAYIRYLTNNPIEGWELSNYSNLICLKKVKPKK